MFVGAQYVNAPQKDVFADDRETCRDYLFSPELDNNLHQAFYSFLKGNTISTLNIFFKYIITDCI